MLHERTDVVGVAEAAQMFSSESDCVLLDVRTPGEFAAVHVEGSLNVPLDQLETWAIPDSCKDESTRLLLLCQSGGRARKAREALASRCANVVVVDGGIAAWQAAGLPVIKSGYSIPLDGQVRLVAGTLVLVGSLLGLLVHPVFSGIAIFVGAGLALSGVTGACPMATFISRMPWNSRSGAASCTHSVK